MGKTDNLTEMLLAWNEGDEQSLEKLFPIVERELRRIAHNYMRRENQNHTLQTTALINEAFIELNNQHSVNWQNRSHFFALAATIMRRILLAHARERMAEKRGGNYQHVSLENALVLTPEKSVELIALDQALERLAVHDRLKSRIVEMRFFGGLTVDETAEVLGIAPITVAVHWRVAKAWLATQIRGEKIFV
jgi:RNA polymerase sigma-70 factor (ECF subfamily)